MIDRDFMRGFVKLYTLWRSSKEPVYGLQILNEMHELGFKLSPGTLYPTLHALREEDDVTVNKQVVGGRIRKLYRATAKGRRELRGVKEKLRILMKEIFEG